MKTLDQVEARIPIDAAHTQTDPSNTFIINQSGSYYLTGNFTASSSKNGIEVAANHVTIDLNGYTLNGAGVGRHGIFAPVGGNVTDLEVRNGVVTGWGAGGTGDIQVVNASRVRVIDVRVHDGTASTGLAAGSDSLMRNCVVIGLTASTGIQVGNGSTVVDCTASSNTGAFSTSEGILAGTKCLILHCVANANATSNGSPTSTSGAGIVTDDDSIVRDCVATGNKGDGIRVGDRSQIINSTANGNGVGTNGAGINTGGSCVIQGNTASTNSGDGIHATSSLSRIEGNLANNNVDGYGINAGTDFIFRNTANGNHGAVTASSTVNYNPSTGANVGPVGNIGTVGTNPFANLQ